MSRSCPGGRRCYKLADCLSVHPVRSAKVVKAFLREHHSLQQFGLGFVFLIIKQSCFRLSFYENDQDLAKPAESDHSLPRGHRAENRPGCATSDAATEVAPEASALKSDGEVSYLWSCDTCGQVS